ncbi:MAG: alkaline phosphatase family protein [Rhodocyclaceae bacterium]|nr:alkaline phosphatase family protein [Rhodocyclaceae bacterium]
MYPAPAELAWRQPAYGGGSILDLVSWARTRVAPGGLEAARACLPAAPGGDSQRVVLALLDGLGDRYLQREGVGTHLLSRRCGRLSSVFPSTTAAAVTTMMTGLSPASHGLNGWVCRGHGRTGLFEPLPMIYHESRKPLRHPLRRHRLFPYPTLYEDLGCPAFVISPAWLAESDFSARHSRGAVIAGYRVLDEIPDLVAFALERLGPRGLVYCYLPHFDSVAHDEGMGASGLKDTLLAIDGCFRQVDTACRAGNAVLAATADHGLIDAPEGDMICLGALPEVLERLAGPVWGERRAAFFRLKDIGLPDFQALVARHWPDAIAWMSADEILSAGLLGPGKPHRDLATRIGDGVMLPRGRGTIVTAAKPEAVHRMRAVHGGLSGEEMDVPLLLGGVA